MDFELKGGLVSLDPADFYAVMKNGRRFRFFIKDGFDAGKLADKVKGCKGMVICLHITRATTIKECQKIVEDLCSGVKKNAVIMWGAGVGRKRKMLVLAVW